MKRILLASMSTLALCACSAFGDDFRPDIAAKPLPSRLDEIAYINVLRQAFVPIPANPNNGMVDDTGNPGNSSSMESDEGQASVSGGETSTDAGSDIQTTNARVLQDRITADSGLCFNGHGLERFRSRLGEGLHNTDGHEDFLESQDKRVNQCITFREYQRPDFSSDTKFSNPASQTNLIEMQTYLAAGFGLTDIYCDRFFTNASANAQNRQFLRDLNTGVDALVGSVLTLSGAGATATGIVNSGFGLADDGLQAYDAAFLIAPDLGAVRELIQASQSEFRKPFFAGSREEMDQYFPRSYPGARAIIERYASQCSFSGMRQLINKSIGGTTDEINSRLQFPRQTRQTNGATPPVEGGTDGSGQGDPQTPPSTSDTPVQVEDGGTEQGNAQMPTSNSDTPPPPSEQTPRVLTIPIG
ncbi:MAG: hypothetical protein ABJP48_00495 [Erythrobacter sp.]